MSAETQSIFTLRFFENDVTPASFTATELGELLKKLESSIKAIVESNYPAADADKFHLSLISIKNESESLGIAIVGEEPAATSAFIDFGRGGKEGTYTNFPKEAYAGFKYVNDIQNEKGCKSSLIHNEELLWELEPDNKVIKQETVTAYSDTNVFGEVKKVGGDKAKVWIALPNGNIFSFSVTKEQAQQLSPLLYKTVGVKGSAKWNLLTNYIIGFKLYEILEYKVGNTRSAINELRNLTDGFWDTLDSSDDINTYLKGE